MWLPDSLSALLSDRQRDHGVGVAILARECASAVGLDPQLAYIAGLLHDVGQVRWTAHLSGGGAWGSPEHLRQIRSHPTWSAELIQAHWPSAPQDLLLGVEQHHERLDGSGYPLGLTTLNAYGEVLAACEVAESLLHPQPYQTVGARCPAQVAEQLRPLALPRAVLDHLVSYLEAQERLAVPAIHSTG